MNILIANVGSIRSNEVRTLALALNKKHTVTIACMAVDSSFKGQAFSAGDIPVRMNQLNYKDVVKNHHAGKAAKNLDAYNNIAAYEFYGTPAEAVSIMLGEVMKNRPDLIVCGINNGVHMGQDIYCSSNIGMAMEGVFFRIPSIAVGIERRPGGHSEEECQNAVKFIEKNIAKIAAMQLPQHTFLNINIPSVEKYEDIKGIAATVMGKLTIIGEFIEKTDPKGKKYFWAKNVERKSADAQESEGTGIRAFEDGYISITPLSYDATDYDELARFVKQQAEKNPTGKKVRGVQ
jgi:5'-nucleotidase